MTIRQTIFDLVVAGLRQAVTTNTYTLYGQTRNFETNIGNSVHPWRSAPFSESELPGVSSSRFR
jgi:hypothetical protein